MFDFEGSKPAGKPSKRRYEFFFGAMKFLIRKTMKDFPSVLTLRCGDEFLAKKPLFVESFVYLRL